ncbi:MAG: MFS transporter [Candidatus Competibacteraceae bacterium]|nr:MFS transporter [Candidatus Competibacteraceae bacterium]MCB1811709.1 MFS transporter [Candidatus Competibacteraceae bacterium]
MSTLSARLSLIFSCLGHAIMHLLAAFYFVIVLQLEQEWQLPYHELIELWTLGALLIGVGAIPAGWLGDHWSAPGMMIVMFLGMGAASIACGLSATPGGLLLGLSALGLFASIYHPVAIAWLMRNAVAQGKALGVNGIFGSAGVAGSGILTGFLIDAYSWRVAFILPGVVSLLAGLLLWWCCWRRIIVDTRTDLKAETPPSRDDMLRGFGILLLTMLVMGIAFHAMQTALPKMFSLRLDFTDSALGIGALIAGVYAISGIMQIVGGHLADRFALKQVYLIGLLLQVPMLALVAQATGMPLIVAATMAIFLNSSVLPAENMLIARYTPAHRRALAYGIKFVLAFSCAPLAVMLVSYIHARTGDFIWLYWLVAVCMLLAFLAALLLPAVHSLRSGLSERSPEPVQAS